jgi:hypothetical protein
MIQRVYDTEQAAIDAEAYFYSLKNYTSATRFAEVRQRATDGKYYWLNPTAEYLVGLVQSDLDKLDNDWPCTLEEYKSNWTIDNDV